MLNTGHIRKGGMKTMQRKVDELGRIVLPVEMREQLYIGERDTLDISVQGNTIVLAKAEDSCIFCKGTENLVKLNRVPVCESCRQRLAGASTGEELTSEA